MSLGICNIAVIPVRREPSGKSEMTTQLLFGETYEIKEEKDGWLRITVAYDGYDGWISQNQHTEIDQSLYDELNNELQSMCSDTVQTIFNDKKEMVIVAGSTLPGFVESTLQINGERLNFNGTVADPNEDRDLDTLELFAKLFLNAPYLWGGRSILGIDCSGFTQVVFKMMGIKLKRDTVEQAKQGTLIENLKASKMGDLAFFSDGSDTISHVGILLADEQIIHASGKVRIDGISDEGIYNPELDKRTHQLKSIKRIVSNNENS
ncbi:MAG: C40 family peptidase [Bacteroidetes bacterium]|nr:C40 family peptidase [Bacteroidota bacterium]